eukprot:Amastigsp_a841500_1778.p4 type:complete len:134 gc:universal Amastigsp_a841500_1778:364-765(+)
MAVLRHHCGEHSVRDLVATCFQTPCAPPHGPRRGAHVPARVRDAPCCASGRSAVLPPLGEHTAPCVRRSSHQSRQAQLSSAAKGRVFGGPYHAHRSAAPDQFCRVGRTHAALLLAQEQNPRRDLPPEASAAAA